ncbi:MAG: DUF1800 domain-containing protein [Dehalococcoidia bacterium]|nr:DUF1800 domain-containing protein [Dehalococcoidia bacterium]
MTTLARATAKTDINLVAHLMRRAAFGLPAWRLEEVARKPYEEIVEDLLDIERFPRPDEDLLERFLIEHADEESYHLESKRWIFRMINSQRPLEEKMTLFWHNRLATAVSKTNNARMMIAHIQMLRDFGMGNYHTLLHRLSRDPAMIWWLDQEMNHNQDTNENWGRELLELFAMGRGNYSEDDVRSAARAFSGWTIEQTIPRYPNGWYDTNFVYREDDHDHGQKTFLGETGDFNGDDILNIVVRHPATAQFVAANLHRFFVSDTPDQKAIDTLAQAYFDSKYEIRAVLRVLFNSDFFKQSRFQRVRWPVESVVGTAVLTGENTDPFEMGLDKLDDAASVMGQELINPPTVEGWHTGREWIDAGYLIQRVNFAAERFGNAETPGISKIVQRIGAGKSSLKAEALIKACEYEMGCIELGEKARATILKELGTNVAVDASFPKKIAYTLQLIGSSREYQLG